MNKLILPINSYIVNSNGSIVDVFSNMPSYGNENGAEVYHVYNADNNAYYNVLMTEELKAVIADTFNMPYAAGSYTGSVRVLTVGSDPKAFEWTPITSLVASPRIQGIYLNDTYLEVGKHGYGTGKENSVTLYAKEPNFLYVTAPSGSAAYISLKSEGRGNGYVYYTEDPYSNNWRYLDYDTSLNVAGKKYYLSGNVNPYVGTNTDNYIHFATSGASTISFYGDITYLVGNTSSSDYTPAYKGGDKTLKNYQFCKLFYNCAQIIKAPDLPSTTLSTCCYIGMFYRCTSLTTAPELPATTLAASCYYEMFYNCTSLTETPELPATTLASSCYQSMFAYCTGLTTAPELPATTLASSCYYGMFVYCTSLTKAPELPATTLASSCYRSMFENCTSLTKAPELPATTLTSSCYYYMFYNCNKLNYVKALFTTAPSTSYTNNWLYGVASTGTFVKSKNATWTTVGTYAVPIGWTPYKTAQLDTDELPESYIEDTGKVLTVDASGLWTKKKIDVGSQIVYDSSNKTISLKDAGGNVLGTPIDATDFIKDGMVSDVSIHDSNMVIGFNTDAGKEDIAIPLADIFDSSNYYTKSETDAMFEETELSTAMALNDLNARVEDASSKISVFAESIDDMRLDITDLSTSISYIDSSIDIIDASISALDTSISALDASVSALDASVKRIDASVKIIDASVKIIDASVKRIDTSVRDMSTYIADISTRVDDNELIVASALSDLDSRIEDVSSRIGGGGSTATDLMTSITYAELRALRDSSSLVPGMQYRMTDYDTKISKQGADSMHHRFDLILTALSKSSLSENCGAAQHDFSAEELQNVSADETHYFDGCNLDAWQIKYSIDNDTDRFDWVYSGRNKDAVLAPLYFSSFNSLTQFTRDSSSDSSVSMNNEHWGNFIYAFTDWNNERYYFDTSVLDGYNLCYYGYTSGSYAPANMGYVTFTPSGFMSGDSDAVPASEYFNKEDFSFRIAITGNTAFDYVAFSRDEKYDNLYAAQGYDTSSGWYAYSYTRTINGGDIAPNFNFVIWHNDSSVDDLVRISPTNGDRPIFYKEPSAIKVTYPPYARRTAIIDGETVSMDINYPQDSYGIIALCAEDTNDLNTWGIKNMPFGFDPSDASMHVYQHWGNCLYVSHGYITEFREYTDADTSSMISKGVIYDMTDEYGNNMPYDFKNIVYNTRGDILVYTFSRIDASSGIVYDATLKPMDINITV